MVTLQYGTKQIGYNVRHINPYISDTNVEDIKPETNGLQLHIRKVPDTYFCIFIKAFNKVW